MFDLAIIGGGPAALSCAMTARQRGLDTIILHHGGKSDWLARAEEITNFPGMPHASGAQILSTLTQQAKDLGATLQEGLVRQVLPMGETYSISVGNDFVEAKAVCLCMGAKKPRLLPGEEQFIGRGVSYCGTCDGMFYRGRDVAVIAQAHEAVEEANFLATLARSVLYFGKPDDALDGCIRVLPDVPSAILGEEHVAGVRAGSEDFPAEGVFIFRDAVALTSLLPGLEGDGAFITVDRMMRTNLPRVYAAGDITGKPLQIAKAVGEGCVAALSAAEDLAKKPEK